jgi:hypothetical protein
MPRRALATFNVQHETDPDAGSDNRDDVRVSAKKALLQMLEPLAGFVSDSGLSAGELHAIFREAAVRSAANRQLQVSDRVNISGIAATTGIARADIAKILRVAEQPVDKVGDSQQQTTNRVLTAWHDDPKFTGPNGQPGDLNMYGRGLSFEALAKKYGRGIPPRAILDELLRAGAVEVLATQKIRAKSAIAVDRGMTARVIKAFGDRATELLSTMLLNMRRPDVPRFIASVAESTVASGSLPLLRRELSMRGADFLADAHEILTRKPRARSLKNRNRDAKRVSVTVFYFESLDGGNAKPPVTGKRRNFRRET